MEDRDRKQKVEGPRHIYRSADATSSTESPARSQVWGDDWVHELIAMTRPGVEIEFPARDIDEREVPFVYDDFR